MPIYEYECKNCCFHFELRKSFGDDGSAPCPVCNAEGRRIFSPVPIIFKGSGFYITDSRAKNGTLDSDYSSKEEKTNSEKTKPESSGSNDKGAAVKSSNDSSE